MKKFYSSLLKIEKYKFLLILFIVYIVVSLIYFLGSKFLLSKDLFWSFPIQNLIFGLKFFLTCSFVGVLSSVLLSKRNKKNLKYMEVENHGFFYRFAKNILFSLKIFLLACLLIFMALFFSSNWKTSEIVEINNKKYYKMTEVIWLNEPIYYFHHYVNPILMEKN